MELLRDEMLKSRKYNPVRTKDYDFPIIEIPLRGEREVGVGEFKLYDTEMKGVFRPDTNKIISTVTEKYTLVPHGKVISNIEEALQDTKYTREVFLTHDGARMFAEYDLLGYDTEITDGDVVRMRLIVKNSYDASHAVSIILEGLRLVCLNGLMGFSSLFSYTRKHVGDFLIGNQIGDIGNNIRRASTIYNDSLIPFWKDMNGKTLNQERGIDIINDTIKAEIIPAKFKDDIQSQWETKVKEYNMWMLYNCYTFTLTHTVKQISYENYINLNRKISHFFRENYAKAA